MSLSHNPEVAGSNPAPATKAAGHRPFPKLGRALALRVLTDLLTPPQAAVKLKTLADRGSIST